MGRKVSIKERAATDAALEILKATKNQNLKAQVAKLLFESDAREKARVDARERQRRADADNEELANLGSQITSLKKQLQAVEDTITSLKAENEEAIQTLKDQIAGKEKIITELV